MVCGVNPARTSTYTSSGERGGFEGEPSRVGQTKQ